MIIIKYKWLDGEKEESIEDIDCPMPISQLVFSIMQRKRKTNKHLELMPLINDAINYEMEQYGLDTLTIVWRDNDE